MKPLRNTLLIRERTDVGPLVGRVPRFKLVGKPGNLFYAEVVAVGEGCSLPVGAVVIVDAYDVAHTTGYGYLAPEHAAIAYLRGPDEEDGDPVPLHGHIMTEWRRPEGGEGLVAPDGRRSDDLPDRGSMLHSEQIVALAATVPRSDELEGGRLVFGSGPDTPTLHWAGRRLRFVPWERALAVE
jgi:hypothetical protein